MNIRIAYADYHNQRVQRILRRVFADVVPTALLLLLMACAMALVARYAETTHFTPVISDGVLIEKISS